MITIYGIPNCDTVKKARTWLTNHSVEHTFHDYKKEGISADKIKNWNKVFPWDKLVNKASTTWKGLSDEEKAKVTDIKAASKLMVSHTSVIKRPLIEDAEGNAIALGFSEKEYERLFGTNP